MASRKKNEKDHHAKKSSGSAEVWRKQKKARNAARPKQNFVNEQWTRVPLIAPLDIVDEANGITR